MAPHNLCLHLPYLVSFNHKIDKHLDRRALPSGFQVWEIIEIIEIQNGDRHGKQLGNAHVRAVQFTSASYFNLHMGHTLDDTHQAHISFIFIVMFKCKDS